jgi:hypothetical protein
MKPIKIFGGYAAKGVCILILFGLIVTGRAQMPDMTDPYLDSWSFSDSTNWTSDAGYAPIAFTNIENVPYCESSNTVFGCNALLLNSTNPAFLNYNVVETNGYTNLICSGGTIWFWFSPDWSSTNQGGTGPGDWGRFIDVGAWTSNANYGWWSLCVSPDGGNIYFSGQTNGIGTNYASFPISWTNNSWHLIGLTYTATNSILYVDDLATNGLGVSYWPGPDVLTNGFYIGSDYSGTEQARGKFVDVETYTDTAEWDSSFFSGYYAYGLSYLTNGSGYDGDGGGATPDFIAPPALVASTNLWLAITNLANNTAWLFLSNTFADVQYEIQGKTNLSATNWISEGFVLGSEITNWTPTSITATNHPTLFLQVRSWADSDGSGLPDWWQLKYFGHTGVDPYGDPDGDGLNNLQEYEYAFNPTVFNAPLAPQGLTVTYNTSTDTADVDWLLSSGPVTGYTVERDDNSGAHYFSFSSSATGFNDDISLDAPDPYNFGNIDVSYRIQAHYTDGDSAWSAFVPVEQNTIIGSIVPGAKATAYLAVSGLPPNTSAIRVTEISEDTYTLDYEIVTNYDIPISSFTNGMCLQPNVILPGDGTYEYSWYGQAVGANGYGLTATTYLSQDYTSPQDDNWLVPPYFDGRQQLKQNLIFQLRAAMADFPFQYTDVGSSGSYYISYPNTTNYVYAGFYQREQVFYDDGSSDYQVSLDTIEPFEENYSYSNFVFNSSGLDANGRIVTGAGGSFSTDQGGVILQEPALYHFQEPSTNGAAISALLGTNQTRWLASFPLDSSGSSDVIQVGINLSGSTYTMTTNTVNFFGLPFLSTQVAYSGRNTTLNPGDSTTHFEYFYSETAQPKFQTVEYDFWPATSLYSSYYIELANTASFPGLPELPAASVNPLLITSVGNPNFRVAGYARLAVTNSYYPGVYGFLGQYFTNAYQIDTNGIVTTNTTGVLSPYGQFFATQPGAAALVTMPDIDTGTRGTCTVYAVSLQLDANHDGTMDTSLNGPDATSQASPMEFWVNDGHDQQGINGNLDTDLQVPPASMNYSTNEITCPRDLENFARLRICGVPQLPTSQGYTVTLSMSSISGNPAINLYYSYETNGGIGYLTNINVAATQTGSAYYDEALRTISTSQNLTLQMDSYGNLLYTNFLFEGAGIGEGQLTMTISQNGNPIAQSSAYLDLHDIKDFYERAVITNNMSGAISNWSSAINSVQPSTVSALGIDTNLIVFVHGFNVGNWDWLNDSEAVFKRLYWSGFNGHFCTVKWPCEPVTAWTFITVDTSIFNDSEIKSYKAGTALKDYLSQLRSRFPNYQLNVLAHSQGNAIMGEAIEQGAPFDTYILTQGAMPASSYDVNATTSSTLLAAEAVYGTPEWQPMGYHGAYTNMIGKIVSYYNPNDSVLNVWNADQVAGKPDGYAKNILAASPYYTYDGVDGWHHSLFNIFTYLVTDPQESRAMISRSRTQTVGRQDTSGVINSTIDLSAHFGFTTGFSEHSAEWTRPIQTSFPYYVQILTTIAP